MANTGRQDMTPVQIAEKVSPERLERHLSSLATIGGMPDGGVNRQVLTVDDRAGRRYLVDLARELDLEISTDAIGNQFFRFPGVDSLAAPAVTTGSHLDTQPTGGRLDGVLGIVAGFEACAAMRDAGFSPHHSIEIVNWTNEEGCRFSPGCMGSMVHVGTKSLQDCLATVDADGITFAEALHDTLVDHPTGAARETGRPMRSYVELHIEQGPVLALAGRPVGVVSSIQGCRWFEIGIFGETRHAGTTPLSARRDALREAVEVVSAISHALSDDRDVLRFTVGRFVVEPGAPNVVPNKVVFTIDLRHPDEAILEQAESLLRRAVVAHVNRCDYKIRRTQVYWFRRKLFRVAE